MYYFEYMSNYIVIYNYIEFYGILGQTIKKLLLFHKLNFVLYFLFLNIIIENKPYIKH